MERFILTLALAATCAAQVYYVPTNTTANGGQAFGMWEASKDIKLSDVAPMTSSAFQMRAEDSITADLYHTTPDTASNLTDKNVAFLSCDPDDYESSDQSNEIFDTALTKKVTAILLYSKYSWYCEKRTTPSEIGSTYVYSIVNGSAANDILKQMDKSSRPSMVFLITIRHQSSEEVSNTRPNGGPGNPLGPSRSTEVAMVILYSITGVITALFMAVIVSGAVRAHRNPERYGPNNALGRPRQSRAKGLARAMLDTIPIVKFGQNQDQNQENPKNDIEIGTIPKQQQEATNGVSNPVSHEEHTENEIAVSKNVNNLTVSTSAANDNNDANAASVVSRAESGSASHNENSISEEALGCSICTDDFELGQDIRVLPCNHKFHPACVDPWLLNVSGTCPLCRIDLQPPACTCSEDAHDDAHHNENNDTLAPPLGDLASPRRRNFVIDIFNPYAQHTTEERVAALRQLREGIGRDHETRDQPASDVPPTPASPTTPGASSFPDGEHTDARRRKRLTMRLQERFNIRTRRNEHPPNDGAENSAPTSPTTLATPQIRSEEPTMTPAIMPPNPENTLDSIVSSSQEQIPTASNESTSAGQPTDGGPPNEDKNTKGST